MSSIKSSTGLASGIDIGGLVDALIKAERASARRLESRLANVNAVRTGLTSVQAQLLSLTTSVDSLKDRATFNSSSVQNTDPQQLTAVSKIGALSGSYQFQAVRLASSQRTVSRGFANTDTQTVGTQGTLVIQQGGGLQRPASLDLLNGGAGVRRGQVRVTDRSGASATVDLRNVTTAQEVLDAFNGSGLAIRVEASGSRFVLRDLTGQTASNLSVQDLGGGFAAADLGLAQSVAASTLSGSEVYRVTSDFSLSSLNDGNGIRHSSTGAELNVTVQSGDSFSVDLSGVVTIGDVISKITAAEGNAGKVSAELVDGRLKLTDLTSGGGTLAVTSLTGSNAAQVLGLDTTASGAELTGRRLGAGMGSVLLRNLRGGEGVSQLGQLTLTDRTGASATVDLSNAESLDDVLTAINSATTTGSVKLKLQAEVNAIGTGLVIRDTSGSTASNLVVADVGPSTLAADLGIAVNSAQTSVTTGSLRLRSVNEATLLSAFSARNAAPQLGSFRITDTAGGQAVVTVTSELRTVGDLLDRINATAGVNITAQLNATGDGIELIDDAAGAGTLSVIEVAGGRTASDLRLLGTGQVGTDGKTRISGRQAQIIQVVATDTLNSLASKINATPGLSRATLTTADSVINPSRLSINSTVSGAAGRLLIDDGGTGLGFTNQEAGRDAILRIGGDGAGTGGLVRTSSTNRFNDAVAGVDVTLLKTSTTAASVTTQLDIEKSVTAVQRFVNAYNTYIDNVETLTKFDTATQTRSALQGTSTPLRLQSRLNSIVNRQFGSTTSQVRSLADAGIRLDKGGKLAFDADRLREAMTDNPNDTRGLFTDLNTGFGTVLSSALDSFTNETTGSLTRELEGLERNAGLITQQVAAIDFRLSVRRTRLETQFAKMEAVLSGLQSQQSSLNSLSNLANSYSSSNR
jgi:flagellar hook-associated protein 2